MAFSKRAAKSLLRGRKKPWSACPAEMASPVGAGKRVGLVIEELRLAVGAGLRFWPEIEDAHKHGHCEASDGERGEPEGRDRTRAELGRMQRGHRRMILQAA